MKLRRYICLCLFLFLGLPIMVQAKYSITGKVNLQGDWAPKVYLAAIDKLNDYYRASTDLVISIAPIQADGSFLITGDNLPNEPRFYRLYLMKEQNRDYDACLFVGGNDHNFVHIVLDNESQLEIIADPAAFSPFGNYQIIGDVLNQSMRQLADIVYPRFEFYKFRFPTELKLSEEKLHQDLKYFADTTTHPIVSLAAIINTDFDEYFDTDRYFYEDFGERLKKEMPHSVYTKNYFRKLNYYTFEESGEIPHLSMWLIGGLGLSSLLLGIYSFYLYQQLKDKTKQMEKLAPIENIETLYEKLTLKEREILALIVAGKSNKEIASQSFIGISTVKTHINKIYSKLEVNSRKAVVNKISKMKN